MGLTYPQEDMRDTDAFRAYFFAADVVIAIVEEGASGSASGDLERRQLERDAASALVPREVEVDLERARAGRSWDACVVGFYYVRPCLLCTQLLRSDALCW